MSKNNVTIRKLDKRTGGTKKYKAHQFHIDSNFLQCSFSLFASKNSYVEESSLLATVAKRESSKLSSPTVLAEEESTLLKQIKYQQLTFKTKGLELVKATHPHFKF